MSKRGEQEAKSIMINKGYSFDNYYDNNTKPSMPDLKIKNGKFLEVTHTEHDMNGWRTPNKFFLLSPEEKDKKCKEAQEAWDRLQLSDYENDNEEEKDAEIVKSHYGFDWYTHRRTEFKCDIKGMSFSEDKIVNKIEGKGKKYPNGDVDLFVFVLKEEYNNAILHQENFLNKIKFVPFRNIYLCVWDLYNDKYELNNPIMVKISMDSLKISKF